MNNLVFLKLGGGLITDKDTPHRVNKRVLRRACSEIYEALTSDPSLRLLIGHGSGSFGHTPAAKYKTREGVKTTDEWQGFLEVWREAKALNTLVMEALEEAQVPALAFAPVAQILTDDRKIIGWNLYQISTALANGLVPVIYGDVIIDRSLGATILSTEEQMEHLAFEMRPQRILLAGIEAGVWQDFPDKNRIISSITPTNFEKIDHMLGGSASTDVTGGMRSKVLSMMNLVKSGSCSEVRIFSGLTPGNVKTALLGKPLGTILSAS